MRNPADFPFDPKARIEGLRGAEKVRAIADRELAGYLLALLDAVEGQPALKRNPRQLKLPQPARWSSCLGEVA